MFAEKSWEMTCGPDYRVQARSGPDVQLSGSAQVFQLLSTRVSFGIYSPSKVNARPHFQQTTRVDLILTWIFHAQSV